MKRGLYAVNFGGGQVDITSGKFTFSCTEAYLIEDGKIGPPVKGATLIGNGPDVLTKVTGIGNDMKLDPGVGTCGKDGRRAGGRRPAEPAGERHHGRRDRRLIGRSYSAGFRRRLSSSSRAFRSCSTAFLERVKRASRS